MGDHRPRPVSTALAALVWLLLAALWLVWAFGAAFFAPNRRWRRRLIPRFPRWTRVHRRIAGRPRRHNRRRRPAPAACAPRRMTSAEKNRRLAQLIARDGLWCQECGLSLDLRLHHLEDAHPEVHHLIPWSACAGEWWANELFNLCLLCGPCNRRIGAGTTRRLERLRAELWASVAA